VVRSFAEAMRRGEWLVTHQGIAFDVNGVLVDGQHRLAAVIEADQPVEMTVFTEVPEGAFDVLDTGKRRTAADVLAIEGEKEQLIRILAAWRPDVSNAADPVTAHRVALKSLARRYLELSDEISDLDELITPLVEALAPQLLARLGIGIEVAGHMLVTAGDNPNRMTCEAAFAMLCGLAPLPASSGITQRHRLNRGGDRQANQALHLAVVSRIRLDPKTRAYLAKKTAQATPSWRSSAASSATSPARSTTCSTQAGRSLPDGHTVAIPDALTPQPLRLLHRRPLRRSAGAVKVQHPTG
jgi:hypothetical protein